MYLLDEVLLELAKFSSEVLETNEPSEEKDIEEFERKVGLTLPEDFRVFLKTYNGINLMGTEVIGIYHGQNSLEDVYYREHTQVYIPQFSYLVPFSNDGRGNFYCMDVSRLNSKKESCPIVFWVSNYNYKDDDSPETVNESFTHFLKEVVIDWTLENYDYNGDEL